MQISAAVMYLHSFEPTPLTMYDTLCLGLLFTPLIGILALGFFASKLDREGVKNDNKNY